MWETRTLRTLANEESGTLAENNPLTFITVDIATSPVTVGVSWRSSGSLHNTVPTFCHKGMQKHASVIGEDVLTFCLEEQGSQQLFADTSNVPKEKHGAAVGGRLGSAV